MLSSPEQRSIAADSDGVWLVLAELNHRIGNELQAALSALRLAKRELASPEPARFIEEAVVRLQCFGNIQQLLDRQRSQGRLAQRLESLCRATSLAKAAPLGIRLTLTLDDVAVDDETAWTVCVVAFELMTNAFKHAFPGGLSGFVGVALRQDGDGLRLTVTDNGVGVGPAESYWRTPGFGSGIIAQLAERLGGSVTRVNGVVGTATTISVPAALRMQ